MEEFCRWTAKICGLTGKMVLRPQLGAHPCCAALSFRRRPPGRRRFVVRPPSLAAGRGPEASRTRAKPSQKARRTEGDQKAAEQAKAEEQDAAKAIAEYKEAAAKLSSSAGAPECVWTGRRITSLLWRDDIDTARRYIDLYDRFGCSSEHLKLAFRCIIEQGPIDPKAADRLASRVHDCWIAPQETTTTSNQTTIRLNDKRRNHSQLRKL